MVMKYRLSDGKEIGAGEIYEIHKYYEAASCAEYIENTLCDMLPEKVLLEMGYETHRLMEKTEFSTMEDTLRLTVYPKAKENIVDWLLCHETATEDFNRYFGTDLEKGCEPCLELVLDWIYEHETLSEDFNRYFEENSIV